MSDDRPDNGDGRRIADFLAMLAAESGSAANTLSAYASDLHQASEILGSKLSVAGPVELQRLSAEWEPLAKASVARKAAALRRFFGFLQEEGVREDDPSHALPKVGGARRLPRTLDHEAIASLFAAIPKTDLRLMALIELLYGSGLRATELVSLDVRAIAVDRPFTILKGKGGR